MVSPPSILRPARESAGTNENENTRFLLLPSMGPRQVRYHYCYYYPDLLTLPLSFVSDLTRQFCSLGSLGSEGLVLLLFNPATTDAANSQNSKQRATPTTPRQHGNKVTLHL